MSSTSVTLSDEQFVNAFGTGDGSPVAEEVADESAAAPTGTEQPEQPATTPVNWDDANQNPYVARLRGMQGSLQREVEARKALEAEKAALEARMFHTTIQDLPQEDQQRAWNEFNAVRAMNAKQTEISSREAELQEAAKEIVVERMAQHYGVDASELVQFADPYTMELYARKVGAITKTARKQTRQSSNADKFEGGGAPSAPKTRQYKGDLEEAAFDFARLKLPSR